MTSTWGIHNDTLADELVTRGFVSVGWDELNLDLRTIRNGRDGLKAELARAFPGKKPMAIANWASVKENDGDIDQDQGDFEHVWNQAGSPR